MLQESCEGSRGWEGRTGSPSPCGGDGGRRNPGDSMQGFVCIPATAELLHTPRGAGRGGTEGCAPSGHSPVPGGRRSDGVLVSAQQHPPSRTAGVDAGVLLLRPPGRGDLVRHRLRQAVPAAVDPQAARLERADQLRQRRLQPVLRPAARPALRRRLRQRRRPSSGPSTARWRRFRRSTPPWPRFPSRRAATPSGSCATTRSTSSTRTGPPTRAARSTTAAASG